MESFENTRLWTLVWTDEMETFENGDVKSVRCHRFQSKSEHVSKMADGLTMLTHAQSQVPVVSSFSGMLVWIGENDMKTLVWMKIFCFVFTAMKTDTLKKKCICANGALNLFLFVVSFSSDSLNFPHLFMWPLIPSGNITSESDLKALYTFSRVHAGPGNPGKYLNFSLAFSRSGKFLENP